MNRRQALKLAFLRRLVKKSRLPSDSAWNRFIEQRSFGQEGPSLKARRKLCAVFLLRTHPACRHDNKCPANGVKLRIQACSIFFLYRIILRLCMPQLVVFSAFIGNERSVGALLDDSAFVEYGYLIAEFAGAQAVAYVYCGFIACNLIEFAVYLRFGNGVKRGGGFNSSWLFSYLLQSII